MDTTAVVALVVAVLSSVVTLTGLLWERKQRRSEFDDARKQWRNEFERKLATERVVVLKEFALQQYENRASTYGPVLTTLGAVRDVPDPVEHMHYRQLDDDPGTLTATAQQLLEHLYGKPGLFMHMSTRNALLEAYQACFEFQARRLDRYKLVNAFFRARRQLRGDMEMIDDDKERERLTERIEDELSAKTFETSRENLK